MRQTQNAGTREAFRRLNYAFLTLVGKGDAKSRHPEILIIAPVTRYDLVRRVNNRNTGRNSEDSNGTYSLFGNQANFIRMIFLAEHEVPGEVGHQTDVASDTEFQAGANLTKRSDVIVVNGIGRQEFRVLIYRDTGNKVMFLIEKL